MDYDFIPQAYKQFGEMNEPEEDEDETTKRGVLDRVLSPLMNTSVTSALYNITDDDPDTTFLGGIGAGLSRQLNPFKDDVSDTHTTADVLDNIFGEADTAVGKVARGVGGFVGDVVLDPMSYTSGLVSGVGKVLRGTGKTKRVVSANKLFSEGVQARTEATMKDCVEIVKNKYNKVPNAETELKHIIDAEASALYENFNKKVAKVVTDEAMNGDGIGIGVANLPFASKLKQGDKMNSIFHRQLVSDKKLREFGDKTVAPYYNAMSDTIRQTKVMQALSKNNKLYTESQIDLMGTLGKYAAMSNMAKKSTVKANSVYKAAENLEGFKDLPPEVQELFNDAYSDGTLEGLIAFWEDKIKMADKSISVEESAVIRDDLLKAKKDAEEKRDYCKSLIEELRKRKEYTLTPDGPVKAQKRHGVTTLTETKKDFDINGVDLEEKMFNDNKFESLLRGLQEEIPEVIDEDIIKADLDIGEEDVIGFIAKHVDEKSGDANFIAKLSKDVDDLYKIAAEVELQNGAKTPPLNRQTQRQIERIEVLKNSSEKLTPKQKEELKRLEYAVNNAKTRAAAMADEVAKMNYEENLAKINSLSAEEKMAFVKDAYRYKPEVYDELIKRLGDTYSGGIKNASFETVEEIAKNATEFDVPVEQMAKDGVWSRSGRLDDNSTATLRNMLNGFYGNTTTSLYRYDEKVGYKLDSATKIFNEKNFDNRTAFVVRKMLLEGKYQEANELIRDVAASTNYKWTFKRVDEKIQNLPMTKELMDKSGRHNIRITSPSALRYDKVDIPIYNSNKTISHSQAVYKHGWEEIKKIIDDGKLDAKAVNDRTHRENIYRLGAMIDPDYVPHGVKPLPDGSLPSGVGVENDFVFKYIDDLVKYDKEYASHFDDIQTKRTGKKPEAPLNYSESSMENASKQVMDREELGKAEFANTANVAQKSPGTVYGSGAVNYERSLDNVYGEDVANFIRNNSVYLNGIKNAQIQQYDHEINQLREVARTTGKEADKAKIAKLEHQRDALIKAKDLEELTDTSFLDDVANIYHALNSENMFGVVGKYAPAEVKKLTNLDDIVKWYADKLGFKFDKEAEFTDNTNRVVKIIQKDDKKSIVNRRRLVDASRETLDKNAKLKQAILSPKDLELIGTRQVNPSGYTEVYSSGLTRELKDGNLTITRLAEDGSPIIDTKRILVGKAKDLKKTLANKGYSDVRFSGKEIENIMPNDIMHIIRTAENYIETEFTNMIRGMNEVELQNFLSKAGPEDMEAYKNIVFRDALFDDATWFAAKKDPKIAEFCKQKLEATYDSLNKEIEVLDGINITDEVSAVDALGEIGYFKNLGVSREKWNKILEVLENMEDPNAPITVFSGLQKSKAEIIKELDAMNKIRPNNYVEMMADLIPRTITEDAQKYMRTLTEVDRNLTYGITPKMSIAEANKIMKERTGVEKWYNDNIAEAFTGFMVESGKDIHQSGTVNQILHSFGKKFNLEDDIPEGDTIVVKAGALKSYISKGQSAKSGKKVINADLSELSKYGLNPDEVQYNTLFVELDKDAYKGILKDYSTGDNYLNAYTMTKDNAKLFNDAAHYQNVESESAFWNMYDKFLTVFKTVNTVPNPGFHINNAVGNAFNSFLYSGAAALNPHKINIARTIIKNPDPKQYININGTKISYADMHDMFRKCGVTGGYFEAEAAKEIKEHWRTLPIIKQGLRVGTEIEETQRGALFIEALMNGNTPDEAMNVVNEFLFDYADLTPEEVKVMKRAIPFYTFMRKNVPLQLREMMLQPELYRNLTKGLNNFERLSGEDYVRDENRSEWRQEYVQVPFKFKGQTFGFDLNLPYEQLDRLTPNKLLGQMTPAIKAPIELASREYAYTGMPVNSLQEYITNQFSIPRAVAVTENKYGADKTLYPIGQLLGMPAGTIRDFSE